MLHPELARTQNSYVSSPVSTGFPGDWASQVLPGYGVHDEKRTEQKERDGERGGK